MRATLLIALLLAVLAWIRASIPADGWVVAKIQLTAIADGSSTSSGWSRQTTEELLVAPQTRQLAASLLQSGHPWITPGFLLDRMPLPDSSAGQEVRLRIASDETAADRLRCYALARAVYLIGADHPANKPWRDRVRELEKQEIELLQRREILNAYAQQLITPQSLVKPISADTAGQFAGPTPHQMILAAADLDARLRITREALASARSALITPGIIVPKLADIAVEFTRHRFILALSVALFVFLVAVEFLVARPYRTISTPLRRIATTDGRPISARKRLPRKFAPPLQSHDTFAIGSERSLVEAQEPSIFDPLALADLEEGTDGDAAETDEDPSKLALLHSPLREMPRSVQYRLMLRDAVLSRAALICLIAALFITPQIVIRRQLPLINRVDLTVRFAGYSKLDPQEQRDLQLEIAKLARSYELRKKAWDRLASSRVNIEPGFLDRELTFHGARALHWDSAGRLTLSIPSSTHGDIARMSSVSESLMQLLNDRARQHAQRMRSLASAHADVRASQQTQQNLAQELSALTAQAQRYPQLKAYLQQLDQVIGQTAGQQQQAARTAHRQVQHEAELAHAAGIRRDELMRKSIENHKQLANARTRLAELQRLTLTYCGPADEAPELRVHDSTAFRMWSLICAALASFCISLGLVMRIGLFRPQPVIVRRSRIQHLPAADWQMFTASPVLTA